MIKLYHFKYDEDSAEVFLKVDTDVFTEEKAKEVLDYFGYSLGEDIITETMKVYAMECIKIATNKDCSKNGVIEEFKNKEGFFSLNEKSGISLNYVSGYEFSEDKMEMNIVDK